MRLFDLSGKNAIVTGSTKGIGRAIASALAEAGARVAISSRTAEDCARVADEISARHNADRAPRAVPIAANVSDAAARDHLIDEAERQLGPVDILVCNAAANPYFGPFLDAPDDAFDKVIEVNIRANMRLARRVVPGMKARGGGTIIVISSIAAIKGGNELGLYGLSKAADLQLVRNIAAAHGPDNIRANAIAPALVRTEFARVLWEDPERARRTAQSYALGRLGEPDDIAGAAVFLAAPAGAWMTGQTLVIDGGWSVKS